MILWLIIKSIFAYPLMVLVTIISSINAIILGFFNPYSGISNASLHFWGRSCLWLSGVKVKVEGLEHLKEDESYIFIANHQSIYDVLALIAVIPGTARFVAKKELFRIPLLAMGMRKSGMLPIDRGNSEEARKMLDKAIDTIKAGCSVIIFAEGTRINNGKINVFKKGGFMLALKGGIPIAPTVLIGTGDIIRGPLKLIHNHTIKIIFRQIVPTDSLTVKDRNSLVWQVHKEMTAVYKEHQKGNLR